MQTALEHSENFENLSKEELVKQLFSLRTENVKAQHHIAYLEAMVNLFQRKKFDSSSERFEGQTPLFNEAEASEADKTPLPAKEVASHKRRRGKREPLPDSLPRIDQVHELAADQRICSCGCELKEFGEVVSEQLDIVPAKIQVLRHRRKKYACSKCEAIITSAMPAQVLPKTNASPGFLAYVATAKYVDALPLYRQESIFRRLGISMPRSTLSRWMIDVSKVLRPIYTALEEDLLDSRVIQMDETTVQVLKGSGKRSNAKSYMWVRCRSGPQSIILFHFNPSRSSQVIRELLRGFRGGIVSDGYDAYRSVSQAQALRHFGCWDHARRGFSDALKINSDCALSEVALSYIRALYAVESRVRDASNTERTKARQLYSASILRHFSRWVSRVRETVLPKSPIGKALAYLDSQWARLTRYVDEGAAPISNCLSENAIRPFVVGRKNWLFSDTAAGAEASAILYSLIESAKANGVEPYAYLRYVLGRIASIETTDDLEALLPWSVAKSL